MYRTLRLAIALVTVFPGSDALQDLASSAGLAAVGAGGGSGSDGMPNGTRIRSLFSRMLSADGRRGSFLNHPMDHPAVEALEQNFSTSGAAAGKVTAGRESANHSVGRSQGGGNGTAATAHRAMVATSRGVVHKAKHQQLVADTCTPGTPGCKSMCRWLKLLADDFYYTVHNFSTCPILESSLTSFGWTAPQLRSERQAPESVDCMVSIARTAVSPPNVQAYVEQLTDCMANISKRTRDDYRISLRLMDRAVSQFHEARALHHNASLAGQRLGAALAIGHQALETKKLEADAIASLEDAMAEAQSIGGHFVNDDLERARQLIEELEPLPALRRVLDEAMARGWESVSSSPSRLDEAVELLVISVREADKVGLTGEPLPAARALLSNATALRNARDELRASVLDGNVTLATQANAGDDIARLEAAISQAEMVGFRTGLPDAVRLLGKLRQAQDARQELADAVAQARSAMSEGSPEEGHTDSELPVEHPAEVRLEAAVAAAQPLGLSGPWAENLLSQLEGRVQARADMVEAVTAGRRILGENSSELVSPRGAKVVAQLEAAVKSGQDVALSAEVAPASELLDRLVAAKSVQEDLEAAMSLGNRTMHAETGDREAIKVLSSALREARGANVTGSVPEAEELLLRLQHHRDARRDLDAAVAASKSAQLTRQGGPQAERALEAALARAEELGLTSVAAAARAQLDRIRVLAHAEEALERARRGPCNVTCMQEVNATIARARALGLDDGSLVDAFKGVVAASSAEERLQAAVAQGRAAAVAGTEVPEAVAVLRAAATTAEWHEKRSGHPSGSLPTARQLLTELSAYGPAKAELDLALVQANASLATSIGTEDALVSLHHAVADARRLNISHRVPETAASLERLTSVARARVQVQAALAQGDIALRAGAGEELAIDELKAAVAEAQQVNVHKSVSRAVMLLGRLMHLEARHQQEEASVRPLHSVLQYDAAMDKQ